MAAAVIYFAAFKSGWVTADPRVFAGIVALLCVTLAASMVVDFVALMRKDLLPNVWIGRALVFGGLLAVGLGGLANWLLSLQGAMVLMEGETKPIVGGLHLDAFEPGLLADTSEFDMILTLAKVELKSGGGGAFYPEIHLLVEPPHGEIERAVIPSDGSVRYRTLWLHGGAFGFAPRVVILKDGETLFDEVVPFTSQRTGGRISFEGLFTVKAHDLGVRGTVLLDSLDEGMRGHPRLGLELSRGGETIGAGTLVPGHFAELNDGYSVGFTGLEKWAEVDISRRTYPVPMFAGAVCAALGVVVWAAAALLARPT